MGYRSCVAMLLYGPKEKCEVVLNLFAVSKVADDDLTGLFERAQQSMTDEKGVHWVFWSFDDVKWYDDAERAREKLFILVEALDEDRAQGGEAGKHEVQPVAIEFARIGESEDDNEWYGTDHNDYHLAIRRDITYPQQFKWAPLST